MTKILQIVPTLGFGGVAQFLLNYYKLMDKTQISFDFITHGEEEEFHRELIDQGSKIFYLQSIGKCGFKNYLRQLKEVLKHHDYDIIHCHDGHLTGFTAMLCKRYYSGPVICHAHTTQCTNPKHKPFMPVFRWMARHYSDKLLGCGEMACRYLFGKNSNYKVIHNAVSIDRFQNVSKRETVQLKAQLRIPDNAYVIGHVGLFCFQKNHAYLVRVFSEVYKRYSNVYLVLVGVGDLMDEVINQCDNLGIRDRVRFAGKQSNIPLFMHLFDVLALPSRFEGLPVVGVEAQAAGLHCVMSSVIDHDVDAGLGIVDFLPITDSNYEKWAEALCRPVERAPRSLIESKFEETGYEIHSSVNSLYSEYQNLIRR